MKPDNFLIGHGKK